MSDDFDDKIPVVVYVRRNADRVIRQFDDTFFGTYIWDEGNYACDCNRAVFFARAADEDEPDISCSDELYAVRIVAKDDGRELYQDEAW